MAVEQEIFAGSLEQATRLRELLRATDDGTWHAGSAEPWVASLLGALIVANDAHTAIEVGGFEGYTSLQLALALARLPHDTLLTVCEIDTTRACDVQDKLGTLEASLAHRTRVVCDDSLRWIPTLADASVDFVWLDGCHEIQHVAQELALLAPKLAPGGIIAGHDVHGVTNLRVCFAAYPGAIALDLSRLGPAGGVGLLQRAR